MLLAMLVLLYPSTFFNPDIDRPFFRGFMWTAPLKALALVGGAALVAGRWPDGTPGLAWMGRGIGSWERIGHVLLAAFLIVCGLQHFAYRAFVDGMVPAWIPPGQRFWTYFTGAALIAGGAGILVPRTARLAGTLSGLMIGLWVVLLHVPRALAGPAHANETAGDLRGPGAERGRSAGGRNAVPDDRARSVATTSGPRTSSSSRTVPIRASRR